MVRSTAASWIETHLQGNIKTSLCVCVCVCVCVWYGGGGGGGGGVCVCTETNFGEIHLFGASWFL